MLNPLHKNALLSTFLHIESRLNEMEPMLAQSKRPSPLDERIHDLSPTEAKVVEDYFARIRSTMVTCLEKHGIPIEVHRVGLRWALQTSLITLSVAVAEVSPDRLRGYGELDDAGRKEILSIQQELDRLLDRMTTGAEPNPAADAADLIRDLNELERAGTTESTPAGNEGSRFPSADGERTPKPP